MPSRALLTESQTIPAADITQALANLGVSRVALGSNVTRTSTTTMSNTGLTALTVTLAASSRYRLTYRFYFDSLPGVRIGFTFPTSLSQFDGKQLSYDDTTGTQFFMGPDWPNVIGASGATTYDSGGTGFGALGMEFTADIKTGSTANTYGDFAVIFAQSVLSATVTTMSKNSCVEVLKY